MRDRLTSEGARFSRVTACTPMTLPLHCTILTGTLPLTHRVRANGRGSLGEQAVTAAEVLSEAGYRYRAVVGAFVLKWMFGLRQAFELYSDSLPAAAPNQPALERSADQTADTAIANPTELAAARFFLWVQFYDPHYPYRLRNGHPEDPREDYAEEIAFTESPPGSHAGSPRASRHRRPTASGGRPTTRPRVDPRAPGRGRALIRARAVRRAPKWRAGGATLSGGGGTGGHGSGRGRGNRICRQRGERENAPARGRGVGCSP